MRPSAVAAALLLAVPIALGGAAVIASSASAAPSPVDLGTASSYAVLGATTVTNTGPTVVSGDLGLSPGTSVTGFPNGTVINGTQHVTDAAAGQAQTDTTTAYNTAAGLTPTGNISADLGGQTLGAGVYAGPTLALNGTLTLDGGNDPAAVFVFQAGSTLITGSTSVVSLTRGADACNVFWQVGSSATLGTNSVFAGTIAALTSVTATTGATVDGRLLARNAAVTLHSNTITRPLCTAAVVASPTATATATVAPAAPTAATSVPTPSVTPTPSVAATPTATHTPSIAPSGTVSPASTPSTPAATPVGPTAPGAPRSASVTSVPGAGPVPAALRDLAAVPAALAAPTAPTAQLPMTGAPVGALLGLGLLSLLLGGFLVWTSRRPTAGLHARTR